MASDATNRKYAKEVMKVYKDLFVERFKEPPPINSYSDLWGFVAMVDDLGGKARAIEVTTHFLSVNGRKPIIDLFRSYHNIDKYLKERAKDAAEQARIRQETKERVARWEELNAK